MSFWLMWLSIELDTESLGEIGEGVSSVRYVLLVRGGLEAFGRLSERPR